MPIASFEIPAYLIHNNIPIYQMYKNDWFDNGPYTYFYSMVPYPDKEEESFDLRDLSSFDAKLSIEDNLRKAIDEKTLPIFQLSEEELYEYFYDQELGSILTTPQQDAGYLFVDELYTRMANGSSQDAFHAYLSDDITNQELTFFLIPERNENNYDGYHLYIYDFKAAWTDLYNTLVTKELFVPASDLTQAFFIAMDVPYPFNPKNYFIPDDEIMVAQDEKEETVEVYLWATDYLVQRAKLQESEKLKFIDSEDMYDLNFYGLFNVKENEIQIGGTYYYVVNGKEVQESFKLPLYDSEKDTLKEIVDAYCKKCTDKSALELVNEVRTEDNLSLINPFEKQTEIIFASIDTEKLKNYLEHDMIMEFDSAKECMDYFNTYDGRNFKTTDELKTFQQEYGFGIGEKWYHISFDEALDVYKTDKNQSLNKMIDGASGRVNDNTIAEKHNIELERG